MIDTTKMKVEDIRAALVQGGMSQEVVDTIKGKAELAAELNKMTEGATPGELVEIDNINEEDFVDVEIIEDSIGDQKETPNDQDEKWTEYVISLMYPDELRDGHPTVDGLRRITEKLIGEVMAVRSTVYQVPDVSNNFHSTVKVTVVVDNGKEVERSADVGPNNTEAVFARHPVACAESRAESRAYRRLLKLRNVISAEEAVKETEIFDIGETIQDNQLIMIDTTAKKLNLNVEKWLAKKEIKLANLLRTPRAKAMQLCEELNSMRTVGVPEEFLDYNANWR